MDLNFLRNLRLKNIFDPMAMGQEQTPTFPQPGVMPVPPMADPNMPQMPPQGPGLYNIAQRMAELYTPETAATDRFNQMANNFPTQAPSSGKRKLGAVALAGLSDVTGNNNGKFIFDELTGKNKLRDDVTNWKTQITPIQQAADNERSTNSNERTMAHQQIADELRQQAQAATAAKNEVDAKIKQQRADVYEFKARNPNMKIIAVKGGNIMAINPITAQKMDTGIPSGSLSDADRIALEQDNAMERIAGQGDQTRQTQGVRHEDTMEEIGARGDESRKTKAVPSATTTTNKPETEAAIRTGRINKATQLINTRPELRKWIQVNGNDIRVTPPSNGGYFSSGPTKQEFDEINNAIYGTSTAKPADNAAAPRDRGAGPGPTTPNNTKTAPLTKQMRNKNTGEVATVISTDGGKTWHRQQ